MRIVHVLHEKAYSRNGEAFLFPLFFHRTRLREYGIRLSFFSGITPTLFNCDTLCISSKFFSAWWQQGKESDLITFLIDARKGVKKIVWFDISDSTGTTQFRVLPYVDRYCKNQLLKVRADYQKHYYGSRIFTDFYHQSFGVDDDNAGEAHLNVIPRTDDLKKLSVGWNSSSAHYGRYGVLLGKLWHAMPFLPRWYAQDWHAPSATRPLAISCRIGGIYRRATVAFSRKKIDDVLASTMQTHKLSRGAYLSELTRSIAVLSPFGLGEITLRDFEIIRCGAVIVKQDMRHCETWPDFWTHGKTYLHFAWDFSDFQEKIEYCMSHPDEMVTRARHAQEIYKGILATEEGHAAFCNRFLAIIQ